MEYWESRLIELGGSPEVSAKRMQQRDSMRRLRKRAADLGYQPTIWARETVWNARRRAKRMGVEITIDADWVRARLASIGGRCEVCGIEFSDQRRGSAHKRPFMPSLDRINAAGGYTPGNTRIVCVAVNMLLQDWGDEVYSRITSAHAEKLAGLT